MNYINVVIDQKSKYTDNYFTYKSIDSVAVGSRVKVCFGKGNKLKDAYVFEINIIPDYEDSKIKFIESIDSDVCLTEEIIQTCIWMKQRYGIKYIDAVKCFVPKGKKAKEGKEKNPLKGTVGEIQNIDGLTDEQQHALSMISDAVMNEYQQNFLVHGITGSGKTELYMQVISKVLAKGKNAVMLVPEIALTKQITDRFIARFGEDKIAILHSKLTQRQRYDEWQRIRKGNARIVIGARLGVFAPLENLGVIILDEEHEATYKSDQTPKYETVDIALKRLMFYDGVLLLGSATPSVVSYSRAKEGIYTLIEMKNRYNNIPLPHVEIVDMREELKEGNKTIFSDLLYRKMVETLDAGQQIILFLNRRGYSTFISCRECGHVLKCPECGISLTYHKSQESGICHYCGKKFAVPSKCPECNSAHIRYFGTGTEKVEEFTKQLFPDKNIARLDLDTADNGKEINKIISDFSKGKTNILIGTQLVAKGLDFKNVGLVGVVAADVSLNIPDYRSTERTFQLVTQVAGRAGRGDSKGFVVVQSYSPENFALKAAAEHDYQAFYDTEIKLRNLMLYPPYSDLIMVEFTADSENLAYDAASDCRNYILRSPLGALAENVFKPKESYNFKGKDSFRYYILIKCPKGLRNKYVYYIRHFGERLKENKSSCNMLIDVNPYSTL